MVMMVVVIMVIQVYLGPIKMMLMVRRPPEYCQNIKYKNSVLIRDIPLGEYLSTFVNNIVRNPPVCPS